VSLSPFTTAPGEERAIWHLGALMEFKATGKETGGQFWLAEQTSNFGYASPVHRHSREDEFFIVLDGGLRVSVGDNHYDISVGGTAFAPRNLAHSFEVTSQDARFLILTTPAGMEDWFFETGQPAPERVVPPLPEHLPDPMKLIASLRAYDVELIAPPAGLKLP
jgi:quercetin dioxygenase-like cupin family protein